MTAKEKLDYLIDEFLFTSNKYNEHCDIKQAKECVAVCLKELLAYSDECNSFGVTIKEYWEEVVKENTKWF